MTTELNRNRRDHANGWEFPNLGTELMWFCCLFVCMAAYPASIDEVTSNTIATDVDKLLNARGKVNWTPMVERIVSYGDQAVPILTNRLANGNDEGRFQFCLVISLCRIGTDASLKPIRDILQDSSRDQELSTTNRSSSEHGVISRYHELTAAIRGYPTNRETEVLPQLIHYSHSFGGISFQANERLRVMIHRHPAAVGVIIASLDDDREQFSYNLGDILNRELGSPFRWPPNPSSPQTSIARYNSFWRDWFERNKQNYKSVAISNAAPDMITK